MISSFYDHPFALSCQYERKYFRLPTFNHLYQSTKKTTSRWKKSVKNNILELEPSIRLPEHFCAPVKVSWISKFSERHFKITPWKIVKFEKSWKTSIEKKKYFWIFVKSALGVVQHSGGEARLDVFQRARFFLKIF